MDLERQMDLVKQAPTKELINEEELRQFFSDSRIT